MEETETEPHESKCVPVFRAACADLTSLQRASTTPRSGTQSRLKWHYQGLRSSKVKRYLPTSSCHPRDRQHGRRRNVWLGGVHVARQFVVLRLRRAAHRRRCRSAEPDKAPDDYGVCEQQAAGGRCDAPRWVGTLAEGPSPRS